MHEWRLVRLLDNGDWDSLDEHNWPQRLEQITTLNFVKDGRSWPASLDGRGTRTLDWWLAILGDVTLDEVRGLIGTRPNWEALSVANPDAPWVRDAAQDSLLDSLPPDSRYGLLWMDFD